MKKITIIVVGVKPGTNMAPTVVSVADIDTTVDNKSIQEQISKAISITLGHPLLQGTTSLSVSHSFI